MPPITRGVRLWQWTAKNGAIDEYHDDAEYARFSPTGDKILLARMNLLGPGDLYIAKADGKDSRKLVGNITLTFGTDLTLPGWLDGETIFYFATRHTYGSGGKSLCLMKIQTDGKSSRNLQPSLDHAVHEIAKNLPEPEPDRGAGVLGAPEIVPGAVVVAPAQVERRWAEVLLSKEGLLVFGTTALLVGIPAYFVLRRLRRSEKRPNTPA